MANVCSRVTTEFTEAIGANALQAATTMERITKLNLDMIIVCVMDDSCEIKKDRGEKE